MEYLVFLTGVALFVIFSFIRTYRFWKRVYVTPEISDLSAKDQKQYEKVKTTWPHEKLALQKMFETKLIAVVFVVMAVISLVIYFLVKFL